MRCSFTPGARSRREPSEPHRRVSDGSFRHPRGARRRAGSTCPCGHCCFPLFDGSPWSHRTRVSSDWGTCGASSHPCPRPPRGRGRDAPTRPVWENALGLHDGAAHRLGLPPAVSHTVSSPKARAARSPRPYDRQGAVRFRKCTRHRSDCGQDTVDRMAHSCCWRPEVQGWGASTVGTALFLAHRWPLSPCVFTGQRGRETELWFFLEGH